MGYCHCFYDWYLLDLFINKLHLAYLIKLDISQTGYNNNIAKLKLTQSIADINIKFYQHELVIIYM